MIVVTVKATFSATLAHLNTSVGTVLYKTGTSQLLPFAYIRCRLIYCSSGLSRYDCRDTSNKWGHVHTLITRDHHAWMDNFFAANIHWNTNTKRRKHETLDESKSDSPWQITVSMANHDFQAPYWSWRIWTLELCTVSGPILSSTLVPTFDRLPATRQQFIIIFPIVKQ